MPGGPGWSVNGARTRWRYADATGSAGGITRIVVRDRGRREAGLVRWVVKGKAAGAVTLPAVGSVRSAFVAGAPAACAALAWGPPGGARPRCDGDATRLACR